MSFLTIEQKRLCCRGLMDPSICGDRYNRLSNNHMCDPILRNYCEIFDTDDICACFTSEIEHPDCFDKKCREVGHIPINMIRKQCPNVLECNQVINISPEAKDNILNLNQYQDCTMEQDGELKEETNVNDASNDDLNANQEEPTEPVEENTEEIVTEKVLPEESENKDNADDNNNTNFIIIGVVIVILLLIILGGGFYMYNKKNN